MYIKKQGFSAPLFVPYLIKVYPSHNMSIWRKNTRSHYTLLRGEGERLNSKRNVRYGTLYWTLQYHSQSRQMFPHLFKNGTTNGKRESRRKGGGKGWELTLCLRIDIFFNMGIGQPHAWGDFIPTSLLSLTPVKRTKNLGSISSEPSWCTIADVLWLDLQCPDYLKCKNRFHILGTKSRTSVLFWRSLPKISSWSQLTVLLPYCINSY